MRTFCLNDKSVEQNLTRLSNNDFRGMRSGRNIIRYRNFDLPLVVRRGQVGVAVAVRVVGARCISKVNASPQKRIVARAPGCREETSRPALVSGSSNGCQFPRSSTEGSVS